jgi:hypothetical protein
MNTNKSNLLLVVLLMVVCAGTVQSQVVPANTNRAYVNFNPDWKYYWESLSAADSTAVVSTSATAYIDASW